MSRTLKHKIKIKKLSPLPSKLADYLYKIYGAALSNKRFGWGINIIKKYYFKYAFTNNEKYRLGLLYDHLAMRTKNKSMKIEYINKAMDIYKNILRQNSKYFLAKYGIGRVYSVRSNLNRAVYHQTKAYKEMLKLPKKQRGAMAIGYLFEKKRDFKKAEQWYLKEYRDCEKNDFGTILNLLDFYKRIKNYKKALTYALKMDKVIKKEFKKKIYRGLKMENSKFLSFIKKEVKIVKLLSLKKEAH